MVEAAVYVDPFKSGIQDRALSYVALSQLSLYRPLLWRHRILKTGKPDPGAINRFSATHPDSAPFAEWSQTAPWTTSWADQTYNSLNTVGWFADCAPWRAARC